MLKLDWSHDFFFFWSVRIGVSPTETTETERGINNPLKKHWVMLLREGKWIQGRLLTGVTIVEE